MILEDFLAPVRESLLDQFTESHPQSWAKQSAIHTELEGLPDVDDMNIAVIGVMEDRGSNNKGTSEAADKVREFLYPLFFGKWSSQVADLGNIYKGEKLEDTLVAVKEVCSQLLKSNTIPVIIGGGQHLTYGNYRAYDNMEQTVNLVCVDSHFDLGNQNEKLNSRNFLSSVILKKPYILFNYSNIGYQTYFTNQEEIDLMERMYFDVYRLGNFRNNIVESEPVLRGADIVSFDVSAVRQSDAPGNLVHSPNGFSGEEACAISRYSGISDKVTSFGIYEYNPSLDLQGRTAHLIAQMIWYFVEGVNARKGDYPFASKDNYQKFTVLINDGEYELVFYKSHLSERWWIEIPFKETTNSSHTRHQLIPCSYQDYLRACENDLPLRWWKAMKKVI